MSIDYLLAVWQEHCNDCRSCEAATECLGVSDYIFAKRLSCQCGKKISYQIAALVR